MPDGTAFNPGAPFTKIWRLRNIGACAWNASYALVFVSGDRMQTRNVFPINYLVLPGRSLIYRRISSPPARRGAIAATGC